MGAANVAVPNESHVKLSDCLVAKIMNLSSAFVAILKLFAEF
jgi:hypothetical protein